MLGFVSALSASVAVMVLLMSVLLANVLATTLEAEQNKDKALLEGTKDNQSVQDEKTNMMKSLVFSHDVVKVMDNPKVKAINVYCSYGNNLTLNTAMTYTIYNTVLIKKNIPNITVSAEKPVEDTKNTNTCFLKSTEHERK
ncbi:TPA: hypothetical protein VEO38_003539 [Providencia alcalifaciens]|nr:hypothetical protein [Providencia alcalifaciens]